MIEFEMAIKTVNESNGQHGHWRAKSSRRKAQRRAVRLGLFGCRLPLLPVVVTITRISAGTLDEHDNLRGALKSVVDEIAEHYGLPDKHPDFEWRYQQERCAPKRYGVRIRIEAKGER